MSIILETKNLCKYFGGVKALEKVSLEVKKGEILGIIGPNGAGKTTFFNVISGFLKPTSGEVFF
jgi:branched-chain amino acid transport system ATP-binding protein